MTVPTVTDTSDIIAMAHNISTKEKPLLSFPKNFFILANPINALL
jgi:hypothetical protein